MRFMARESRWCFGTESLQLMQQQLLKPNVVSYGISVACQAQPGRVARVVLSPAFGDCPRRAEVQPSQLVKNHVIGPLPCQSYGVPRQKKT